VADSARTKEGLEVTVRRSKTDQDAAGAVVAIPYGSHPHTCPVRALGHWLDVAEISGGPLWREVDRHGNLGSERLHVNSVVYIVKRSN
jgi:hypothetical protein